MDIETTRVVASGAATLAVGIGASLSLAIAGALLTAVLPGWDTQTWAAIIWALSVALKPFSLVWALLVALAVTYLHVGWRRQRHTYVRRGRHRPEYVKAHPWTPVRTWTVAA